MSNFLLNPNTEISWANRHGVIHHVDPKSVLIDFDDAAELEFYTPSAIYTAYANNVFKIATTNTGGTYITNGTTNRTQAEQKEIKRMRAYVTRLDESGKGKWGKARQKRIIKEVGEQLGESPDKRPSASTLARRLKDWLQSGMNPNTLLGNTKVRKPRKSSFSKETLDLIDDVIFEQYLTKNGPNKEECYRYFKQLHQLKLPTHRCIGRSAFIERLDDLDPYEVTLARKGAEAARRLENDYAGELIIPTYPLECVELDAVHLNVGILDEKTDEYLGTLIVYVGIDRFTRCVLGYSMSIKGKGQGENSASVIELLKHMSQPKPDMPHTVNQWAEFGLGRLNLLDGGRANIGENISAVLAKTQVARIITPTKTPKKKPFVERFFKTFRGQFASKLPGYSPSRMRGEVLEENFSSSACLYLSEVKEALDFYIVDVYHQSGHSGLDNQAPSAVWKHFENSMPLSPMIRPEVFDAYAGTMQEGTLQKSKGIQKHKLFYQCPALRQLYRDLTKNKKPKDRTKIKYIYNREDLSCIYVINPNDMSTICVPCTDRRISKGMTLTQFKNRETETPKAEKKAFTEANEMLSEAKKRQLGRKKKAPSKSKDKLQTAQPQKDETLDELTATGHSGDTHVIDPPENTAEQTNETDSVFSNSNAAYSKRG